MKIGIILGSTRGGQRLGMRVVRYVAAKAATVPGAEFTVLDLADYDLPFFDEALSPMSNPDRRVSAQVARWLDDIAALDGYVFVVPEYNFGVPAAMKNALDLLKSEADGKPAFIQSYSETSYGGNIAGHLFRLTVNKLGMFPMPKSLGMAHAEQLLDEDGNLVADTEWAGIIDRFIPWSLRELVRYAGALAPLRAPLEPSLQLSSERSSGAALCLSSNSTSFRLTIPASTTGGGSPSVSRRST